MDDEEAVSQKVSGTRNGSEAVSNLKKRLSGKTPCFKCSEENSSANRCCSNCGAPLALQEFVTRQIQDLEHQLIHNKRVEKAIAHEVFESAWKKMRFFGVIWMAAFAVALGSLGWHIWDASKIIDEKAAEFQRKSDKTESGIAASAKEAEETARDAEDAAFKAKNDVKSISAAAEADMRDRESSINQIKNDALKKYNELQPLAMEVPVMRQNLEKAQSQLRVQAQEVSRAEEFAKALWRTHVVLPITFESLSGPLTATAPQSDKESHKSGIWFGITAKNGRQPTLLYELLPQAPIDGSLQVQFENQTFAPPGSTRLIHNLVVLFLKDPPQALVSHTIYISYFPDATDMFRIHSIGRDPKDKDRVITDQGLLPKFLEHDPNFKGNGLCAVTGPDSWQCPPKGMPTTK